jgi:hypothetical protein
MNAEPTPVDPTAGRAPPIALPSPVRPPIVEPPGHAKPGGPSIRRTVANHSVDPTHRFHGPTHRGDTRNAVAASEALQRVRGRHFGGSLRAQQKKGAS